MKNLAINSALALTFGVIMSTQAHAADNRVNYNGSYCDAANGSDASKFNKSVAGITNIDSTARIITCPVIMDEVTNTTGTWSILVNVSASTGCFFVSMNGDGTNRQSQGATVSAGWGFIPNITADDTGGFGGSYMMFCSLPAGATLHTIAVAEKP